MIYISSAGISINFGLKPNWVLEDKNHQRITANRNTHLLKHVECLQLIFSGFLIITRAMLCTSAVFAVERSVRTILSPIPLILYTKSNSIFSPVCTRHYSEGHLDHIPSVDYTQKLHCSQINCAMLAEGSHGFVSDIWAFLLTTVKVHMLKKVKPERT